MMRSNTLARHISALERARLRREEQDKTLRDALVLLHAQHAELEQKCEAVVCALEQHRALEATCAQHIAAMLDGQERFALEQLNHHRLYAQMLADQLPALENAVAAARLAVEEKRAAIAHQQSAIAANLARIDSCTGRIGNLKKLQAQHEEAQEEAELEDGTGARMHRQRRRHA